MNVRLFVVVAAILLVGAVSAQAQAPTVDIKFQFQAAGKLWEPGTYSVDFASNGDVVLKPVKGGVAIEVPRTKLLAGRSVRKEILVIAHGGPFDEPENVGKALARMPGVQGFFGASSIERLPTERAIRGQVEAFKALKVA